MEHGEWLILVLYLIGILVTMVAFGFGSPNMEKVGAYPTLPVATQALNPCTEVYKPCPVGGVTCKVGVGTSQYCGGNLISYQTCSTATTSCASMCSAGSCYEGYVATFCCDAGSDQFRIDPCGADITGIPYPPGEGPVPPPDVTPTPGCVPHSTVCSPCFPACDDVIRLCDNGCNDWNDACHTACGTIPVRAMVVDGDDTSCTAVFDSSVGVDGTVHQFTTSSKTQPDPQTQSGIEYSNFGGLRPGSYTVNSQAPSDYVPVRSCWYKYGVSGEGLTATLGDNEVLVWELGYTQGTAWSQV